MQITVDGKTTRARAFPKRDQFAPELLYFSDCIRKDREPEPSGREGLADVRVIRALLRVGAHAGGPSRCAGSTRPPADARDGEATAARPDARPRSRGNPVGRVDERDHTTSQDSDRGGKPSFSRDGRIPRIGGSFAGRTPLRTAPRIGR